MSQINYEEDRVQSVTQADAAKSLSNKVIELKNYTDRDFLLLSGDPKVIGLAIAVACDINNGKYTTLTWDRQEKMYYPTEFNIHERGEINEQDKL